jgi:hypothetical protein
MSHPRRVGFALLYAVFFLSGVAAILYQLVWQRALLTLLGTDSESVTLVVSAFLLGLGTGGFAGGGLSRTRVPDGDRRRPPPTPRAPSAPRPRSFPTSSGSRTFWPAATGP